MSNFKLMRSKVQTDFIKDEISTAVKNSYIPGDFGPLRTMNLYKEAFGEKFVTPHINSSWQHLVSAYAADFHDPVTRLTCSRNSQYLYKTELYEHFPKTIKYLEDFAKEQNSTVQRVIFARLLPGADVLPHTDSGEYFRLRDRFHLVIESENGCEFLCNGESQIFREGELWWFANKAKHSVKNLSENPRLHIIFDLLPHHTFTTRAKMYYRFTSFFFETYRSLHGGKQLETYLETHPYLKNMMISGPHKNNLKNQGA